MFKKLTIITTASLILLAAGVLQAEPRTSKGKQKDQQVEQKRPQEIKKKAQRRMTESRQKKIARQEQQTRDKTPQAKRPVRQEKQAEMPRRPVKTQQRPQVAVAQRFNRWFDALKKAYRQDDREQMGELIRKVEELRKARPMLQDKVPARPERQGRIERLRDVDRPEHDRKMEVRKDTDRPQIRQRLIQERMLRDETLRPRTRIGARREKAGPMQRFELRDIPGRPFRGVRQRHQRGPQQYPMYDRQIRQGRGENRRIGAGPYHRPMYDRPGLQGRREQNRQGLQGYRRMDEQKRYRGWGVESQRPNRRQNTYRGQRGRARNLRPERGYRNQGRDLDREDNTKLRPRRREMMPQWDW